MEFGWLDFLIVLVIVIGAILAVIYIKKHKRRCLGCGGDCDSCPMHDSCSKKNTNC